MNSVAKLLVIVMLFPALVCAQGRGSGAGVGRSVPAKGDEGTVLNLVTILLNLTDAQRQQIQTIFDAAGKTAAPIMAQIESSKDSLFDAVKMGKNDEEIKTIAAQQGLLRTQILKLQAETFAKMLTLLTTDQKAQADTFIYDEIGQFLSNFSYGKIGQYLSNAGVSTAPSSPMPTVANPARNPDCICHW